jgi:hypothetical protein
MATRRVELPFECSSGYLCQRAAAVAAADHVDADVTSVEGQKQKESTMHKAYLVDAHNIIPHIHQKRVRIHKVHLPWNIQQAK